MLRNGEGMREEKTGSNLLETTHDQGGEKKRSRSDSLQTSFKYKNVMVLLLSIVHLFKTKLFKGWTR